MEIKISENLDFLLIESFGKTDTMEEYKGLSKRYYDEITKRDFTKALIDERKIELPMDFSSHMELVDYYYQVENIPNLRSLKIAVIPKPEHKAMSDFWELYSSNSGFNFKVFSDLDKAKKWLLEI